MPSSCIRDNGNGPGLEACWNWIGSYLSRHQAGAPPHRPNGERNLIGRDGSVSGMLLYARADAGLDPDFDVTIQGNRISARTLDLNLPWDLLRAQLEQITTWLD